MNRKIAIVSCAALSALALGACSSGGDAPEPEATPTEQPTPSIEIPEVSNGSTIDFKINPDGLDAGTSVRVGVYGGGFEENEPTCEEEITSTEIVTGEGQARGTVPVDSPGQYQVVMSTDGFASPCDDPSATTTVKAQPSIFLDGDLEADGEGTVGADPGEPFDVAVILDGELPEDTQVPVRVAAYGPYSTEPEMRADQCNDGKLIAEQTIDWTGDDTNRAKNPYTSTQMTIDGTKGIYLLKASTEGSESVAATQTDCENYQSVMKVSTKQGADTSGDQSDEDKGTNVLTGNRDDAEDK